MRTPHRSSERSLRELQRALANISPAAHSMSQYSAIFRKALDEFSRKVRRVLSEEALLRLKYNTNGMSLEESKDRLKDLGKRIEDACRRFEAKHGWDPRDKKHYVDQEPVIKY